MAGEVIDIITKLTYEAQTSGLDKAFASIEKNIDAIGDQYDSIARLEALKEKTDKADLTRINQINVALENRKKKIQENTKVIASQIAVNDKLKASLQNQFGAYDVLAQKQQRLAGATSSANIAMVNFSRVVQDAPFGILGIANNIDPLVASFTKLKAETGSTKGALQALVGSLTGPLGLGLAVSAVSSLLIVFGDELFNTKKATDEAKESYDKFVESLSKDVEGALSGTDKQVSRLRLLRNILNDVNATEEQRKRAIEEVQQLQPGITREAILQGDIFDQLEEQVAAKEQSNALSEGAVKLAAQNRDLQKQVLAIEKERIAAQKELDRQRGANVGTTASEERVAAAADALRRVEQRANSVNRQIQNNREAQRDLERRAAQQAVRAGDAFFGGSGDKASDDKAYKEALERVDNQYQLSLLNDKALQILRSQLDTEIEIARLRRERRAAEGVIVSPEIAKAEDEALDKETKRIKQVIELRKEQLQLGSELQKAEVAARFKRELDNAKFQVSAQELDIKIRSVRIETDTIQPIEVNNTAFERPSTEGLRRSQAEISNLVNGKSSKEIRERNFKEIISSYRSLAQTISGIIQSISDRQIAALDREYEIRQERVRQAEELAERGNAEILRQETERLNAVSREREKAAARQVQLNALMAASNSALALTEAIKGILAAGSTTAAEGGGIVGYIAAIVAGLAAVASLYASIRSATEAGSGFAGGGFTGEGGKYEPAGIVHKGEFVFNKEATQRIGLPMLEALHEGNMHPLALSAKQRTEDREMHRKMERLIEATEGIYFRGENIVDKDGVRQMWTTSVKQHRRAMSR